MGLCHHCYAIPTHGETHLNGCPDLLPAGEKKKEAIRAWECGYKEGYCRSKQDVAGNSHYRLGYMRGWIATVVDISKNINFSDGPADSGHDDSPACVYPNKKDRIRIDPYKDLHAEDKKPDDDGENK